MKEYFEDGIKVQEYTFQDWWDGNIIVKPSLVKSDSNQLFSYLNGAVLDNIQPGKNLIFNVYDKDSGCIHEELGKMYTLLPIEEWKKIEAKQKEIYDQKIAEGFELKKENFLNEYSKKSQDPDNLLRMEIEMFSKVLFEENFPLENLPPERSLDIPIKGLDFSIIGIEIIRSRYSQIIIKGNKDYHIIKSPNDKISLNDTNGYYDIQAEIIKKYLDWLKEFKEIKKENKKSRMEIAKINESNKLRLLDKLCIIDYFNSNKFKIELFFCGNEHYKNEAKLDLGDIRTAEKTNEKIQDAWRTNELSLDIIQDAEVSDLHKLLENKFEEAKRTNGFKTFKSFAVHEAKNIRSMYTQYFDWFPILKQWVEFLEKVDHENLGSSNQIVSSVKEKTSNEDLRTKEYIKSQIEVIDQDGWEYSFFNEEEYNQFLNLLTYFFDNKPYDIPNETIRLKKGCKTKLAKAFNAIHERCTEKKLRSDKKFFEIIRVLSHFKNLSDNDIYSSITK